MNQPASPSIPSQLPARHAIRRASARSRLALRKHACNAARQRPPLEAPARMLSYRHPHPHVRTHGNVCTYARISHDASARCCSSMRCGAPVRVLVKSIHVARLRVHAWASVARSTLIMPAWCGQGMQEHAYGCTCVWVHMRIGSHAYWRTCCAPCNNATGSKDAPSAQSA